MYFIDSVKSNTFFRSFPGGSMVKNRWPMQEDPRDMGSIPGLGRFPGEGNGDLLQDSCLENSVDRGAWWATAHRVAELNMSVTEHTHTMWGVLMWWSSEVPSVGQWGIFPGPLTILEYWWGHIRGEAGEFLGGIRRPLDV